jgi:hypothetical protein
MEFQIIPKDQWFELVEGFGEKSVEVDITLCGPAAPDNIKEIHNV